MKKLIFVLISMMSAKLWAQELPQEATFVRPCYVVIDDVLQSEIKISGNDWSLTHTAFEDNGCRTPYLAFEIQSKIQNQKSQPSGFQNLDLSAQEVSYTAFSDEVAETMNLMNYCGFDNWKKDEKKIVTGLTCDEFDAPAKDEVLYTIFQLSKDASSFLLGTESKDANGLSEKTRHQQLDPKKFIRQ